MIRAINALCTYQIYTLISLESGDKRGVYLLSAPDRELPAAWTSQRWSRCFGSSLFHKHKLVQKQICVPDPFIFSPTSGAAVIRRGRVDLRSVNEPLSFETALHRRLLPF